MAFAACAEAAGAKARRSGLRPAQRRWPFGAAAAPVCPASDGHRQPARTKPIPHRSAGEDPRCRPFPVACTNIDNMSREQAHRSSHVEARSQNSLAIPVPACRPSRRLHPATAQPSPFATRTQLSVGIDDERARRAASLPPRLPSGASTAAPDQSHCVGNAKAAVRRVDGQDPTAPSVATAPKHVSAAPKPHQPNGGLPLQGHCRGKKGRCPIAPSCKSS